MRVAIVVALVVAGCSLLHPAVSVDPNATFAAHLEHGGLAVDRLDHVAHAELRPPGFLRLPGAPTFVLDADGKTLAALWLAGSEVTVRSTVSEGSPTIGRVEPSWEDGAVRLALQTTDGAAIRSDTFARQGAGGGPPVLTRAGQNVLEVRGVYEAPVRDGHGATVGWLRVSVSPYQAAPRIYEASLPASVPPALAAASAGALNAEIDWIEEHVINVYRGTGTGPLEHSVPIGH
jgi:hypothetical protein